MKIILCLFMVLIFLPSLAVARTTFFDNENDFFIMANNSGSVNSEIPNEDVSIGHSSFCQTGYFLLNNKCVKQNFDNGSAPKNYTEKSSGKPKEKKLFWAYLLGILIFLTLIIIFYLNKRKK